MAEHHDTAIRSLGELSRALEQMAEFTPDGRRTGADRYGAALASMRMYVAHHVAQDHEAAFVCPRCGKRSWNPNDKEHGYCAWCHWWTGSELLGSPDVIAQAEADGAIATLDGVRT